MHTFVLDQVIHRLSIDFLAPGFAAFIAGGARVLDDSFKIGLQLRPSSFINGQLARGRGLVPAGGVVIFRYLMQTELSIEIRTDKFGGVNYAAFKRRENVARCQQLGADSKFGIDPSCETGDTHFQAFQVFGLFYGLSEPAGHLYAGVAAKERYQIELVINLAPEFKTAAVIHPTVESDEIHSERHGTEVLAGESFAGPEIGIGVVHLDGARRHCVKAGRGRDQLAGTIKLNL